MTKINAHVITAKQFYKGNVSDAIKSYERYTWDHGGLRDEAKELFRLIDIAERKNIFFQNSKNPFFKGK
jgi:hypothetical protein